MNFFDGINWENYAAAISVACAVLTGLVWLVRAEMQRNFVSHQDHDRLGQRIAAVEEKLDGMATQEDVRDLERRLRPVETGVQVLAAKLDGVAASAGKIEHMLGILIKANLKEGGE